MLVSVSYHFVVLFIFIFTGTGIASDAFASFILVVHTSPFHFICLFFKVEVSVQLELSLWGWYYSLSGQPCSSPRSEQKIPYMPATVP